ncbi:MAG TPA: YWFCY domain-containing protein, partial [Puia sp.]|nr:YWFCY domain-containing protein [Puia sp.]
MHQSTHSPYRDITRLSMGISIACLGLHFYYAGYWAFNQWGLTSRITDRILQVVVQTGLLDGFAVHGIIGFFLALSLTGAPARKSVTVSWRGILAYLLSGAVLFCASPLVLVRVGDAMATIVVYFFFTLLGYLLL